MIYFNTCSKAFFKSQGLSEKDCFNAQGMTQSEYHPIMKRRNKLIAYNTPPCKNGHTLRIRSGQCPQCNTAVLRFIQRSSEKGYVYIAASLKGKISKVGFTSSVQTLSESLNRTSYVILQDWEILFASQSDKAGKIEEKVKSTLYQYTDTVDYEHDGKRQIASELLRCNYLKNRETILEICKANKYRYEVVLNSDNSIYQFGNLKKEMKNPSNTEERTHYVQKTLIEGLFK